MNMKIKPKQKAVLYRWAFVPSDVNRQDMHLRGQVYGHPRFERGELIVTSPVLRFDRETEVAETRNTIYLLASDW